MEVRRANITDMKDVLDFMEAWHPTCGMENVPFDRQSCVKIVEYYVYSKDTLPLIAKNDKGDITGMLFGSLEPYFFNKKHCYGTDLMFIARGGGPELWRRFKEWAFGLGADRIIMGVSSGDPRACQLLEVLGMINTGGMYVLHRQSS